MKRNFMLPNRLLYGAIVCAVLCSIFVFIFKKPLCERRFSSTQEIDLIYQSGDVNYVIAHSLEFLNDLEACRASGHRFRTGEYEQCLWGASKNLIAAYGSLGDEVHMKQYLSLWASNMSGLHKEYVYTIDKMLSVCDNTIVGIRRPPWLDIEMYKSTARRVIKESEPTGQP